MMNETVLPQDHIVYDSAFMALPDDRKRQLLDLLSLDKSDIIIIATPGTSQPELAAILAEALGAPAAIAKSPELPAGTASTTPTATSYAPHRELLPGLLKAHGDNTLGFAETSIVGGGVVVTRAPNGVPTSVQWTLSTPTTTRVMTLLGYWLPPSLVVYITPISDAIIDEVQRQDSLPLLRAMPVNASALPTDQSPEVDPRATDHIIYVRYTCCLNRVCVMH